ncbi:hypothetical protein ACFB49_20480 [Sphingomonas sp. DBB INV C78]
MVGGGNVEQPLPIDHAGISPHHWPMQIAGHPRIAIDPAICGGRPIVAGTRVRVTDVLEMLAGGANEAEIVEDFPYLSPEDVRACIGYAAQALDHPVVLAAE